MAKKIDSRNSVACQYDRLEFFNVKYVLQRTAGHSMQYSKIRAITEQLTGVSFRYHATRVKNGAEAEARGRGLPNGDAVAF